MELQTSGSDCSGGDGGDNGGGDNEYCSKSGGVGVVVVLARLR